MPSDHAGKMQVGFTALAQADPCWSLHDLLAPRQAVGQESAACSGGAAKLVHFAPTRRYIAAR